MRQFAGGRPRLAGAVAAAANDGSCSRARATFSPGAVTVSGATRLPPRPMIRVDDGDRRLGIAPPQMPARTFGDQQIDQRRHDEQSKYSR